jgi:hypothetical protein
VFQRKGVVPQACLNGTSRLRDLVFATSSPSGPRAGRWWYGVTRGVTTFARGHGSHVRHNGDHLEREHGIISSVKGAWRQPYEARPVAPQWPRPAEGAGPALMDTRTPLPASTIRGMSAPNRWEGRADLGRDSLLVAGLPLDDDGAGW